MDIWQRRNHYDLLEIPSGASRDEITRVSLAMAMWLWHEFRGATGKAWARRMRCKEL
jgi:hypothetical protein